MNNTELYKQTENNLTLKQRKEIKKNMPALLLDTSGSMNWSVEPGQTRIGALRNIVNNLKMAGNIYYFNDVCQACLKDAIPNPAGGTMMSVAFNYLKSQGIKKVIMITDGEAVDKVEALNAVIGLELQVMFVGSGEVPEFLNELVRVSGGSFATKENLTLPKELTAKIQLLLGAGTGDQTICL